VSGETVPNPGSTEALAKGCTCPCLDNGHGRGCGRYDKHGVPVFWIAGDCPLHGGKKEGDK
jgi:hypothetical protein